jgi:DNA-nicking Smr family endonuclease
MAGRSSERRRAATAAELALWRKAAGDVRPLSGRQHRDSLETPIPEEPAPSESTAPRRAAATSRPPPPPEPGLDRRSAERLRRGQLPIEARLDLHGMRQDEAHDALAAFLARADARGLRCVLVITGRGLRRAAEADWRPESIGILKTAVPRWLADPAQRTRILGIAEAQPKHGGAGALYILLRRKRA